MPEVRFTDYFRERLRLRAIPEETVRGILLHSTERYSDVETGRWIAVGRARFGRKGNRLLMIAYDREGDILSAVTVHDVTRAQVRRRVEQQRWVLE